MLVSRAETLDDRALAEALHDAEKYLLSWPEICSYRPIDPGNPKLRTLLAHKVDSGAWKLLWVPPSMPYYRPARGSFVDGNVQDFTKSLVFSSWLVVPKVIAMLISYEAERRMVTGFDNSADYTTERRQRNPLLQFTFSQDRPTGMSAFPLIYPCLTLATEIDPLTICSKAARDGSAPSVQRVQDEISRQIQDLVSPILEKFPSSGGQADERWYTTVGTRPVDTMPSSSAATCRTLASMHFASAYLGS